MRILIWAALGCLLTFIGGAEALAGTGEALSGGSGHAGPHPLSIIPFAALLGMIATGPLFYEHFWHKNYPKIAIALAAVTVAYYLGALGNTHAPVHAFFEYFQFIALLSSLFIASGGILIDVDRKGSPLANVLILAFGAVIANLIGTTGASMLLIRPFIRLNKSRIQPYHVVFFIFAVSNMGGCLTPIGDPPLFLGFLKGVPFEWTLVHCLPEWVTGISIVCAVFFFIDRRNTKVNPLFAEEDEVEKSGKITIKGRRNFIWLAVAVGSVFLDPNVVNTPGNEWLPYIHYDGANFSFVREIIMFSVCFFSYRFANQQAIRGNEFNFEPIREVAYIFIGIFGTMMPALELVAGFAASPEGKALIGHNSLYWGTGLMSGFLDNAPTYVNFLTAAMAAQGAEIGVPQEVSNFASGEGFQDSILQLTAISVSAVFFGAMTYIGNGPNFMVKSIAEQVGVEMPSFFGYILRFSLPVLVPILVLVWLIFFAFAH